MAKLIFKYTKSDNFISNREPSKIQFNISDEMNITEFKVICMRLASSLGYHQNSITKEFGSETEGEDISDTNIKNIFKNLFSDDK